MIPLILSITCSSLIFVIFKLFRRFHIDMLQAIVSNYFTAAIIGFVLYGNEWNSNNLVDTGWIKFALFTSLLFISLFFLMGKSSQSNGVASTSIAVKMSMAVSLIIMIYAYHEETSILKITGIVLAILGVFLVSFSFDKKRSINKAAWMLFVLFIGSGALDFTLNYVQKFELGTMTTSLFSAFALGTAGIIGLGILTYSAIATKLKLELKNVAAGIILGIPNYFSIYLLMLSYSTTGWKDSTVLAITNVSVVLCSALIGFLAFKESTTAAKIIGLISAILAIVTLYIAN